MSNNSDNPNDCDSSLQYVSVTGDFSRHLGFPQPPDPYSDYSTHESELNHGSQKHSLEGLEAVENLYVATGTIKIEKEKKGRLKESNMESKPKEVKMYIYLNNDVVLLMDVEDGANTTVSELIQCIISDDQLGLPKSAANIFSLWMSTSLLAIQLKPIHKPLVVRASWPMLISKYSQSRTPKLLGEEPLLVLQRNVFFSKSIEEKVKDERVIDLLYAEARNNILEGRYPCDVARYLVLGGIQARIELGPYNPQVHTLHFFRENHHRFLPACLCNGRWSSWFRLSGKDSPEFRLLEHYKRLPERRLHRKYLEICWSLPFYGSAFFQAQIEQPVTGLTSLITHKDTPVLVAINSQGVYVINQAQCVLLLGLKYDELSWDFAKPSQEDNLDCLPCLFLQFSLVENGTRVSKILQLFSRQAVMMDALISSFVDELKHKPNNEEPNDKLALINSGSGIKDDHSLLSLSCVSEPCQLFCNKLNKLTLATFDDEGRCIGQMGSWSFSY